MTPREKQVMQEIPLMKCGNKAEFLQRLQWLSEGMLRNHLESVTNYTQSRSEIEAYLAFKRSNHENTLCYIVTT